MFSKNKVVLVLAFVLLICISHAQDNVALPPDLQPIVRENAMHITEIGEPFYQAERGYTRVVEFSHDNTLLFADYWFGEHVLWSLNPLESQTRIALEIPVCDAVFSPDDSLIVISGYDGNIYGYDVSSTEQVFTANRYAKERDDTGSYCVMVAFNESTMAYLDGGIVHLWDYKSRTEPESLQTPGDRLLFSPDGTLLAIALENGDIEIWDVATRKRKLTLTGHQSRISSFAFNPTGSQLASASEADVAGRGRLFLWDVDSGNRPASLFKGKDEDEIFDLVFSSDGSMLAFHGAWTITLWNVDNWEPVEDFPEFVRPTDLAFNVDSSLVIFTTLYATVEIWDFADNKVYTHTLSQEKPCEGWVNSLDISNDGRLIAAGDECGTVRLLGMSR